MTRFHLLSFYGGALQQTYWLGVPILKSPLDCWVYQELIHDLRPQLIVNAAAYTAVDQAERESVLAEAINARAPGVFAEEAKRLDAVLIHYSTDYVFDGLAATPYTEEAPTFPLNVYGRSKLRGEQAIVASGAAAVVLRTSWVYAARGRNFFLTIRRLAKERDELRVVADQWGIPNWSRTLAEATARLVGWRFVFTSPSPAAFRRAAELANWNLGQWPLQQFMELVASPSISTGAAKG